MLGLYFMSGLTSLLTSAGATEAKFTRLQDGPHVKTLAENCKLEKFKIGTKTKFILETSNFGVKYSDNLSCSERFQKYQKNNKHKNFGWI